MNKNKKGFTLIELLAVIIILAVIALIAIPEVIDIIAKARKSAFEDSVYGIIRAGEMYYTNELLENGGMSEDKEFIIENGKFKGDKLPISGSLPNSGKVKVTTDGDVALALSDGKYYVQKTTTESEIETKELKKENITEEELDYKEETGRPNPIFTTATGETSIPACITNNTECSAGTKVGVQVNASKKYDFYVMSEDVSKGTITLIMNQNLGGTVAWINAEDYGSSSIKNDKGPITALNYLESQTSSWTNIPLETYELTDDNSTPKYPTMTRTARARMITYTEATGLGCISSNANSCPTWLYENLSSSSAPHVYWTSSADADRSSHAWGVGCLGGTGSNSVNFDDGFGMRPVITISKSAV